MWSDWLVFYDCGFSLSALWYPLASYDAPIPSYLGFSYLEHGVSLHGCSNKVQPLLLTLDVGYLLTGASPDPGCGLATLGCSCPMQQLWKQKKQNGKKREKNAKKEKWLSEEASQIAVKRREVKSKGEKERYTHLNAEFHRRARRDKIAFLSDQWKEIEENNRMGKTRDLFKKIRLPREHFMQKWAQYRTEMVWT